MKRSRVIFGLSALVLLASAGQAQDERYIERQVLDPSALEWIVSPVDEPLASDPGPIGQARLALLEGRPRDAQKLLEKWLEENAGNDRYYEGVYLLGESHFQRGDYWAAYEKFDEVSNATAGELFRKSLVRSVDVARAFLSGEKRVMWKVLRISAYDDGIEILDRVWEKAPGTRIGEQALKLKADYFFEVGKHDLAQDEYAALANEFPNGRYLSLAMLRAAESAQAAFPGTAYDDRALIEADTRYRQVQDEFPAYAEREQVAARLDSIRDLRGMKDLRVGEWYDRIGQEGAAGYYYRMILEDYPGTLAATLAERKLEQRGVGSGGTPSEAGR